MKLVSRSLIVVLCASACGLFGLAGVAQAAAPTIGEVSSLEVSATSATLQAEINPEASETTYRFEYDTSEYATNTAHGGSAPSPEGEVPQAPTPATVMVHLQGLTPATVYHYRVAATNAAHEVAYGHDETFTTPQSGGEFALPDGRVWEQVSPTDKHGGLIQPLTLEGGVIQAAEGGSAIT
jgi:phosphodiesterase/alkaline phosphatase D-like protein